MTNNQASETLKTLNIPSTIHNIRALTLGEKLLPMVMPRADGSYFVPHTCEAKMQETVYLGSNPVDAHCSCQEWAVHHRTRITADENWLCVHGAAAILFTLPRAICSQPQEDRGYPLDDAPPLACPSTENQYLLAFKNLLHDNRHYFAAMELSCEDILRYYSIVHHTKPHLILQRDWAIITAEVQMLVKKPGYLQSRARHMKKTLEAHPQ